MNNCHNPSRRRPVTKCVVIDSALRTLLFIPAEAASGPVRGDVVGSPFHLQILGWSSTSKINTIYSGRPHRDKRYCIQHFRSTNNELFEAVNSKQPIV